MVDKISASIGVIGLLGVGACYWLLDRRMEDAAREVAALRTRVDALEGRSAALDGRLGQVEQHARDLDTRLGDQNVRLTAVDGKADGIATALDSQVAALDSRLATSEQSGDLRARLLEQRADRLEQETSKRAAVDAATERERQRLLDEPSKFVTCQSVGILHRGFINSYSRVTEVTFANSSPYSIADIRGNVEYRANGQLLGSVPATASGLILAGKTTKLSVTAGEIVAAADAHETVFVVTSVVIVGGK